MCDILCVTNRALCEEDFLLRIKKIAEKRPKGIILREKDLEKGEYKALAESVIKICKDFGVPCILHSFYDVAIELGHDAIHLPLPVLKEMPIKDKEKFSVIGVSCHSLSEAREAEGLGATYITAGHIFETDCKKDLPGRGLDFLKNICKNVNIPVYAIGGISGENFCDIRRAGAKGGCVMSGSMMCRDIDKYFNAFGGKYENR